MPYEHISGSFTGFSHGSALPGWTDTKQVVSVPRTELWTLGKSKRLKQEGHDAEHLRRCQVLFHSTHIC